MSEEKRNSVPPSGEGVDESTSVPDSSVPASAPMKPMRIIALGKGTLEPPPREEPNLESSVEAADSDENVDDVDHVDDVELVDSSVSEPVPDARAKMASIPPPAPSSQSSETTAVSPLGEGFENLQADDATIDIPDVSPIPTPVDYIGDNTEEIDELDDDVEPASDPGHEPPPPSSAAPPPTKRKGAPVPVNPARERRPRAWWDEIFNDDFGRVFAPLPAACLKQESDFIVSSLGLAAGATILDLACGGGEFSIELAKHGYGVVGIDASLSQLASAGDLAQQHGQRINFIQADLRDLDYESTFDAVVFWGASFGYFEDEKNAEVLRLIFRALKPGGKLILDVPNRDFTIQTEPNQSWFQMDGCLCMDDMNLDYISSRVRVKRTMMLDDGRNLEATYSMRVYSLHELGRIMHEAGYRVSQVTGHPVTPGVFIGNCSHRIIMLAHKPEA